MLSHRISRWIKLFAIIIAILVADQITKRLIVTNLSVGETLRPIPALSPVFQLTLSHNTGSAFGFLPQAGDLFLIVAVVVVIGMVIFYPRIPDDGRIVRLATGLVCGGALGNASDRLTYGFVIDFIHYQIPGVISNVSNLADHAIVFGVILFFIESWRSDRQKKAVVEMPATE
jgi:signal peptidase II